MGYSGGGEGIGIKYIDATHRLSIDPETGNIIAEELVDDIWQPGSFEAGANSFWLRYVGLAGIGHHLATELKDGHFHFFAHSEFDGELTTQDTQIIYAYNYEARRIYQPDDSTTFTGKNIEFTFPSDVHVLAENVYYKTGPTGPTTPVKIQVWKGSDDTGLKVFDQTYPASDFTADSEIQLAYNGYVEYDEDQTYFLRYSCDTAFSLKADATTSYVWFAADVSDVREDSILQVRSYESRSDGVYSFTSGEDWAIENNKIYICNATGTQTGDFASNSDKWETIGDSHITYNEVANYASLPDPAEHTSKMYIVLNSTGFDWNRRKGLYHSDGVTWTRLSNVSFEVTDADALFRDDLDNSKIAKFELSEISADTTRTYNFPDVSGRIFVDGMTADVMLNGDLNLNSAGKIVNMVNPTLDQDAATKNYVDSHSVNGAWTRTGTVLSPTNAGDTVGFGTDVRWNTRANTGANLELQDAIPEYYNSELDLWIPTGIAAGSEGLWIGDTQIVPYNGLTSWKTRTGEITLPVHVHHDLDYIGTDQRAHYRTGIDRLTNFVIQPIVTDEWVGTLLPHYGTAFIGGVFHSFTTVAGNTKPNAAVEFYIFTGHITKAQFFADKVTNRLLKTYIPASTWDYEITPFTIEFEAGLELHIGEEYTAFLYSPDGDFSFLGAPDPIWNPWETEEIFQPFFEVDVTRQEIRYTIDYGDDENVTVPSNLFSTAGDIAAMTGNLFAFGETGESTNTMIGGAGINALSLNQSIGIGFDALYNSTALQNVISIGHASGAGSSGEDCLYLGKQAGENNTVDGKLFIANVTDVLLEGSFTDKWLKVHGEITTEFHGGFGHYENLAFTSEDIMLDDDGAWRNINSVSSTEGHTAPNGEDTAVQYSFGWMGLVAKGYWNDFEEATEYTVSVWAKFISGDGAVFRVNLGGDGISGPSITTTSEWVRYEMPLTSGTANGELHLWKMTSTGIIQFWGWQINTGNIALPYIKTHRNPTELNYGSWTNGYLPDTNIHGNLTLGVDTYDLDRNKLNIITDAGNNLAQPLRLITNASGAGAATGIIFQTTSLIHLYGKGGIFFESDGSGYGQGSLHLCNAGSGTADVTIAHSAIKIDSSRRVGVGMNYADVPKANLHLVASNATSAFDTIANDRGMIITGKEGYTRLYFESANAATNLGTFVIDNNYGQLRFGSLNDGALTDRQAHFIVLDSATGFIGIGHKDPLARLDVSGDAIVSTELTVGKYATTAGKITILDSGSKTEPPEIFSDALGNLTLKATANTANIIMNIDGFQGYFVVQDQTDTNLMTVRHTTGNTWIKGTTTLGGSLILEDPSVTFDSTLVFNDGTRDRLSLQSTIAIISSANGYSSFQIFDSSMKMVQDSIARIGVDGESSYLRSHNENNLLVVDNTNTTITGPFNVNGNTVIMGDVTVDGELYHRGGPKGATGILQNYVEFSHEYVDPGNFNLSTTWWWHNEAENTITSVTEAAPDLSDSATRIDIGDGGFYDDIVILRGFKNTNPLANDTTYTVSMWVRLESGDGDFLIAATTNSEIRIATSEWKRYWYTFTTDSSVEHLVEIHKKTALGTFDIWGWQVVDGENLTQFVPGFGDPSLYLSPDWGASVNGEFVVNNAFRDVFKVQSTGGRFNFFNSKSGQSTEPGGLWIHNVTSGDASLSFSAGLADRWTIYQDASQQYRFRFYNSAIDESVLAITTVGDLELNIADAKIKSSDGTGYFQFGYGGDILWRDVDNSVDRFEVNNTNTHLRSPDGDNDIAVNNIGVAIGINSTSGNFLVHDESAVELFNIDKDGNTRFTGNSVINSPTTTGLALNIQANDLITGMALSVASNSADTSTRNLVRILNDNALATGTTALSIQQDSTGLALEVIGSAKFDTDTLFVDSVNHRLGVNNLSPNVDLDINGNAEVHGSNPTNTCFLVQNSNLTTGILSYFYSDSTSSEERELVRIRNTSGAADMTTCFALHQDANHIGLHAHLHGVTTGVGMQYDADYLTTGTLANFHSNSSSAQVRSLVKIKNDHISATGTYCLTLQNDASAMGLHADGCGIKISGGGAFHIEDGNVLLNGDDADLILNGGADMTVDGNLSIVTLKNGASIHIQDDGVILMTTGTFAWSGAGEFIPPQLSQTTIDAMAKTKGMMWYNTTFDKHQGYDGTIRNFY
jgi:hypothetical protein